MCTNHTKSFDFVSVGGLLELIHDLVVGFC